MNHGERGLGGVFVAVVLLLVAVGALAVLALSRATRSVERGDEVMTRFRGIQDALVQYVAANERLPCPANPATDDGDEVTGGAAGTCAFPEGTVPWRTIGARRDEALDPWGARISYRVYTGAAGSLTQARGASLVNCDTAEPSPIAATALSGSEGGLCQPNLSVTLRATPPASFLVAGKGFTVNDLGAAQSGVAYVLVSHGATGLGGYNANGVRREMPAGDELSNTSANGPFYVKPFSAAGTDVTSAAHFDDYVAYRKLEDLVKAAGTYARDWPEETSLTFDQATVETAVGASVTPGSSVGSTTVTFVGVVALGTSGGGTPTDISFELAGGQGGIGVAGGGSALLQSSANESLTLVFSDTTNTKFAATVGDFGTYGGTFIELVEFAFYAGGTNVATKVGAGCNADGGLASFSMDVGAAFDAVVITPVPALDTSTFLFSGITAMLVSEVSACHSSATTCVTSLTDPGNTCSIP